MTTDEWIGRTIPARDTDPATSHNATEQILIKAGTQRAVILGAYYSQAALDRDGLTDDEAQEVSGVSILSCWWKRCSELREGGYIAPTGKVRNGAAGVDRMICKVTPEGLRALYGIES